MSTNEQTPVSQSTSVVRNTLWKEQVPQDLGGPAFDAALREYCDRNYHQLLPIITEKVHQEKVQQEKLKVVKARLNFEEPSQHSESGTLICCCQFLICCLILASGLIMLAVSVHKLLHQTPSRRKKERLGSKHVCSMSGSPEARDKVKSTSAHSNDSRRRSYYSSRKDTESCYQSSRSKETEFASEKRHNKRASPQKREVLSEIEDSAGGHWKSKPKGKGRVLRMTYPSHSYDDLKESFLENYLQQKKCIKDPVEIHNIKQRDKESMEECVRRYKLKCRDVKGAPECMKISEFMHEITNPELIKRLHDKIQNLVDEMMRVMTTFLRGDVADSNHERKKSFSSWKQQEAGHKPNFKKGGFRNQQRSERKQDRFTLLTKIPKEILALDEGKFKPPPLMTTPVEKRNTGKFYEFHREVEHATDECIHLKRKIKEMLKPNKRLLKLSPESLISFPPLGDEDGTKGPMISKAEMGGHFVHRMYVDGGSSSEVLYEHCFNRFLMIQETSPLVGFSGEIIWPLGEISLFVKMDDEEHSTSAWMNFMVVRSPSPYNRIIGRPGKPAYMTGVSRHIAEHRLNIHKGCLPFRQKKRGQALKRNKVIYEEVEKLVGTGIMKEVHYHSWLSNPEMVKKHEGGCRMCVDFKDLNKACPKDSYSLPEIDWKVESLCGYPFKCFMDAYKGYHKVKMAKEDEEKTAFITSQGIFC
nr:reverse transcriptase domain-containing protein [Tanacetum cinerariifolium]